MAPSETSPSPKTLVRIPFFSISLGTPFSFKLETHGAKEQEKKYKNLNVHEEDTWFRRKTRPPNRVVVVGSDSELLFPFPLSRPSKSVGRNVMNT